MVGCVIEKCTEPPFLGAACRPEERGGKKSGMLRHKEPPEGSGCLRRVDGAAVGEAFDVGAAGLGDLAGAGDGVVIEEAPEVAELGEGG